MHHCYRRVGSRNQRTFLQRWPYTTQLSKYLSNSISTSIAEWYKAIVARMSFGTVTWVRFPPPVKRTAIKVSWVSLQHMPCAASFSFGLRSLLILFVADSSTVEFDDRLTTDLESRTLTYVTVHETPYTSQGIDYTLETLDEI